MKHDRAVIVFAREPRLGKVKTRLARDISKENTLKLYQAFVRDVLGVAAKAKAEPYLFYHGRPGYTPFLSRYARNFRLVRQLGKDLGLRMDSAFKYAFRQGYKSCIIIGSDCLTITPGMLDKGFEKLEQKDCVLGPSTDGGYYLIGLKAHMPQLFKGIKWSTGSVYRQTVDKLSTLGKNHHNLLKLEDIDTSLNLRRLGKVMYKYPALIHTTNIIKNNKIYN